MEHTHPLAKLVAMTAAKSSTTALLDRGSPAKSSFHPWKRAAPGAPLATSEPPASSSPSSASTTAAQVTSFHDASQHTPSPADSAISRPPSVTEVTIGTPMYGPLSAYADTSWLAAAGGAASTAGGSVAQWFEVHSSFPGAVPGATWMDPATGFRTSYSPQDYATIQNPFATAPSFSSTLFAGQGVSAGAALALSGAATPARNPASLTSTSSAPRARLASRSNCGCPNCRELERLGPAAAHIRKSHAHNCHVPGCGKIYQKPSHLKAHLRWHSGTRPFVCNWLFCGKRFTRSDELQRHARLHSADKKLVCPQANCGKKFSRSDQLSKHCIGHAQEKPEAARARPEGMDTNDNLDPVPTINTASAQIAASSGISRRPDCQSNSEAC